MSWRLGSRTSLLADSFEENWVVMMMAFERGELSEEKTLALLQDFIDNDQVHLLPDDYVATIDRLLALGYLDGEVME